MDYNKLLLDELRLVPYIKTDIELTDDLIAKSVTLNENLQSIGYCLSPADIVSLAVSPSMDGFYDMVRGMMDQVKANPMYPGFPEQVMEMDEAVFRFHQLVHYFSTYGMEAYFGVAVKRGWLPCEKDMPDVLYEPENLLRAKTIGLLPIEDIYIVPLNIILSRRERMTLPEHEIVSVAISHVTSEQVASLHVKFKENLTALYKIIFEKEDHEKAFHMLRSLCQHTGDVLECVDSLLKQYRFHFRTTQKRFLVKLLESYPEKDFRSNLVLSGKGAERNILLLNYLDYSVYSRSTSHMNAVNDLRDGHLRSWESIVKKMLSENADGVLDFIAGRPGMMLRMVAWLIRLGYSQKEILEKLSPRAATLSMQTLITNLNHFGKLTKEERADSSLLFETFEDLLKTRMRSCITPLQNKQVFIRMDNFDLDASEIHCNDKSAEGGYIRSGIAYRIPESIKRLRFFVYWNDDCRVDVDLHAGFTTLSGDRCGVGWNQNFRDSGVIFSGDITHSDAAEYIDIDLTAPLDRVHANIHLFSGRPNFDAVQTCYVGMMAAPVRNKNNQDNKLYSETNCFFKHNLRQKCATINYGYIDIRRRCLVFDGNPGEWHCDWYGGPKHRQGRFSLARYLNLLAEAQNTSFCDSEEDADIILVMGKADSEKEVSLIDSNFFID